MDEQTREHEGASSSADNATDTDIVSKSQEDDLWIFGFGSLIWKAGTALLSVEKQRLEGCIKGFRRVFYQGSTDHRQSIISLGPAAIARTRGTPEAPGRTVTLEPCSGGIVVGAAYLLSGTPSEQQQTIQELEWREKQYDVREYVPVFESANDTSPLIDRALLYIASPNKARNANYLGPAPEEDIARQIASAHGPSGANSEYLFRLVQAVRQMGVSEAHLEWLDKRVKELLRTSGEKS